jgi:carboxypeptidase PM20D1
MKRLLRRLLTLVVLLVAVAAGRTLLLVDDVPAHPTPPASWRPNAAAAAERLAEAVRIPTISSAPGVTDTAAFLAFHAWLADRYPAAHAVLAREAVGESLLLTWPGERPEEPALLLASHMDVVPADPADWTHPPFGGVIADGWIWGRGTLDDKFGVVGIMEAVEALATEGFRPERTVILAFGHDEEVGGAAGAARMAALLASRGVRIGMALDEGLVITEGMLPAVDRPVALVGLGEKGYLSVRLRTTATGGHASMPERETAVGVLAAAVARIEGQPFAASLDGPARRLFDTVGPAMRWPLKMVMTNLWLFGPLVKRQLLAKPATAALVRTTTAATMLRAGTKENVLAREAEAVFNFRIRPGETRQTVLAGLRERIDDPRVAIEPLPGMSMDPSPLSAAAGPHWDNLRSSIGAVFPKSIVAPSLVVGATDGRWYADVAEAVYRFGPLQLTGPDLARLHGIDERISIDNFAAVITFYHDLIQRTTK